MKKTRKLRSFDNLSTMNHFFFPSGPTPRWVFKLFLAVASAVLGAFLSFPGMRLANMYLDSLFYCRETRVML